jgi:hypothetical protein
MSLDPTAEFRWHRIKHTIEHDAHTHLQENPDITDDEIHDASWDYADSHSNIIYTHRSRMIWVMCNEVQEYESDELVDTGDEDSIDKRIQICVFLAHESEFAAKLQELIEKRDSDGDSENAHNADGSK